VLSSTLSFFSDARAFPFRLSTDLSAAKHADLLFVKDKLDGENDLADYCVSLEVFSSSCEEEEEEERDGESGSSLSGVSFGSFA